MNLSTKIKRRLPISVVIITHNVIDTIEMCLEPLKKVSDDIIVVDSFSDDGTVEVCERMGVRLISQEWLGYSQTKNLGNEMAKYDWILSIDSDEVLSDELINSINNLDLKKGHIYALDRLTNFCGKWIYHCGWYPEWKVRLFNKKNIKWQGDFVHETLNVPNDFTEIKLNGKLFHYSYKDKEDHLKRIKKYAQLSALERFEKRKKASFVLRWFSPMARFVKTYILKAGFLDGKAGFQISRGNAYMVKLRYAILKEMWESKK